jgi:sec-independent protein translocase protein TatC
MTLTDRLKRSSKTKASPDSMTLLEHLTEMRSRLFIIVIAICIGSVAAFFGYTQILHFLREPYCRANHGHCELYVTSPLDGLSLRLKVSLFGGFALASPVILYELWCFITPGLKKQEKRYAIPFVIASVTLFLLGASIAYISFEHALSFLAQIGGNELQQIYNPNQYLSLILLLMFLFGAAFEFPVILVALQLARVISSSQLLSWWRWAVILITVVAAVFTPSGDPLSMLALAVPLIFFYFLSILIGKLARR